MRTRGFLSKYDIWQVEVVKGSISFWPFGSLSVHFKLANQKLETNLKVYV